MKNIICLFSTIVLLASCAPEEDEISYLSAEGQTMGTYYKVTYLDSLQRDFSHPIDSLLIQINSEISTYEPNSTISQFNQADSVFSLGANFKDYADCLNYPQRCGKVKNIHFLLNFKEAKIAHERTRHAFDPTVMSLVNYWGFGYTPKEPVTNVDSLKIDSLMQYVGFEKVQLFDRGGYAMLRKSSPNVQLDFGGTGQGYGIDAVSEFLEIHDIENYLVDIGGECRSRGKNPKGEWWTIGVNTPLPEADIMDFTQIIQLPNMSVSTSGNYRNFHEVDGQKYSHFISPITGFPEKSKLLSASVFHENCTYPDALATGFMVLGLEEAYTLADQLEGIEALFIYADEAGMLQVKYTPGVEELLVAYDE